MSKKTSGRTRSAGVVQVVGEIETRAGLAQRSELARARQALAEIRSFIQGTAETVWDLGQALSRFSERKDYVALGYASFSACLEAERLMSEAQAHKLVRIARRFSRDELVALGGIDKADRLIAYTKATTGQDTPAGLVAQDALIGRIPLSQASAEDIARETKAARAARRQNASNSENRRSEKARADLARERWVKQQLRELGWKVAATKTRGGKVLIELDATLVARWMRRG